ncbi:MAG: protein phosphatase 2C domain-containing protein [Methylophilus sp.]|jgi:PPM family protein phosphatase
MKFTIYQGSRQGSRPYNQDRMAYSYSKEALLMVLADGMGGHRHGEIAAQIAVTTLTESFQKLAQPTLSSPAKFLTTHIQKVHDMIESVRIKDGLLESPRTTIVAAIIQNNTMYCAHVGDSRLYHFRDGRLLFKTEDHSVVQSLYSKGIISKADMATHPYRHKIHNCLGGEQAPKIDLADKSLVFDGDIILLCSDGVWGVIDDKSIKNTLFSGEITETVYQLLDTSEKDGGSTSDNMSAIGLFWGDKPKNPLTISTVTMPIDQTTTIMNVHESNTDGHTLDADDLSDEAINRILAEINSALNKTNPKKK